MGKPLSAAHKAKISASLKARASGTKVKRGLQPSYTRRGPDKNIAGGGIVIGRTKPGASAKAPGAKFTSSKVRYVIKSSGPVRMA